MLDPKFTEQIIAAWQADELHPHRGRVRRVLPPRNALQEFIDATFLATLRDEEGQQVRFSVALVLPDDLAAPKNPIMLAPIPLESCVEFSAASLVKLAGAFDPELTTIVVQWNANTGVFSYRGITFHAPGLNRFTEVPVGVEGSANFRPDYFAVIAKGRAALTIARGSSQIGTLQAGYFVAASPTPFTSNSLGRHVHSAIQKDPLFTAHENQYWLYARDAMELLLSEASMRGHGGTIVLLPSYLPPSSGLYATKYGLTGSFGLQQALKRCIENERDIAFGIAFRKVANEIIQRIANLSAVDGALLVTFGFEVVAFGATLTAPRSTSSAIVGPDGYGNARNTAFDINRYGTRHRSAFDFASAQRGSIVFVISQDGPIRAFHREDDTTVYVWPDCTASMFV
ncbi:MAG: putative sensor domain DACNV-containing protein [Thiobacillus sp.]